MTRESTQPVSKKKETSWQQLVASYQHPDERRSWIQFLSSLIAYLAFWYLTYRALSISVWLVIPLAVLGGGFLIRLFIIFHDCGHGSFFQSRRLNDVVGMISGFFSLTPYYQWRHSHAVHHATSGDLGRRGVGDVWTMTVKEYLEAPRRTQLYYRLYRNPLFMFVLGPVVIFVIGHRFAHKDSRKRERNNVYWTNAALLAVLVIMHLTIGIKAFWLVQLPILLVAGSAGIWLFYVQHQFEGVYWQEHEEWDYVTAALQGSSFYKLPRILQWFTGSIGFHHIHHLSPRIPNYRLEACHNDNELFQQIPPVTLVSSMKSLRFRLYDDEKGQLVGFNYVKRLQLDMAQAS